jgi:polyphosphate kinase
VAPEDTRADQAARYINRELSWLDFNDRVLSMAEDKDVPLLERAKFLAIYSQGLDEFFQVRVAGLKDQQAVGLGPTSADGMTPAEQLRGICDRVRELSERENGVFL